jgi:arylsulfatase A-like enzyme
VEQQVSLADIAPTALDWAGIDASEGTEGRSLMHLIDGSDERDSTAYAEVWFHDRAALSRYLRRSVDSGELTGGGYETFLNQRIVRTSRYKYSRRGSELDPGDWAASDGEFVRACHEKLLSRVADQDLAREHVRQLRDGNLTRNELAAELATRNLEREALYDLAADPREEVNLLVLAGALARMGVVHPAAEIARELAAVMADIEPTGDLMSTRRTGESVTNRPTEDGLVRVESRLRDLGYID